MSREKYVEKYFMCRFSIDHTANQVVKSNILYVISPLLGIYTRIPVILYASMKLSSRSLIFILARNIQSTHMIIPCVIKTM